MFAVSCVSLTIFPVYSSRMTIPFSFLDIFFLRIFMVLLPLCCVLLKDILLFYMNPVKLCVSVCFQWSTWILLYFGDLGSISIHEYMSVVPVDSKSFYKIFSERSSSSSLTCESNKETLYTEVRFVQEYCLPLPAPFLGLEI